MPDAVRPALKPVLSVLLAAGLAVAGGCRKDLERDPCLQPRNAPLRIQTRQRVDTVLTDSFLPSPTLVPLGGTTNLRYAARTNVVQLYLAPDRDSCRYAIFPDSTSRLGDTLTLRYTRRLQFLSNACGYTYFFTLQSAAITGNGLDSFRITNSAVDNNANSPAHLQLYYRR